MNQNPLVSVVMPAYNAEKYIEQAVKSILKQSHSNIELLVADDASADGTKKKLDSFLSDTRVKAFHNQNNLGYLLTSNKLFEKCSGDFITFMDADDWSHLQRIEKMLNEFKKDPQLGCVGSFVQRVNENGTETSLIKFKTAYTEILADLPGEFNFVGSALMFKKEAFIYAGPYEVVFNRIGSEDLYWAAKTFLKFKAINIPEVLYYYRESDTSVSGQNKKSIRGQLSKELAQVALQKFKTETIDIFEKKNESLLAETLKYLLMKYNFWNGNYFSGLSFYFSGLGKNKMQFTDKNKLVKMYSAKWLRQRLSFSKN
jgi:glycosyltransferase involved in cell wall biosynthesis